MNLILSREIHHELMWTNSAIGCYKNRCNCANCIMTKLLESGPCMMKYTVEELLLREGPPVDITPDNDYYINERNNIMARRPLSKGYLLKFEYDRGAYSFTADYKIIVYKNKKGHPEFNCSTLIVSKQDVMEKYGKKGALELYKKLGGTLDLSKYNLGLIANEVIKLLDELAVDVKIEREQKQKTIIDSNKEFKSPGRPKNTGVRGFKVLDNINIDEMKLPPQARACAIILLQSNKKEFTIEEMKELINEKQEMLNTKQNPYRIFDYYKNKLKLNNIIDYTY